MISLQDPQVVELNVGDILRLVTTFGYRGPSRQLTLYAAIGSQGMLWFDEIIASERTIDLPESLNSFTTCEESIDIPITDVISGGTGYDLMAKLPENEAPETQKTGSEHKQLEEALETKPGYTGAALNLLQHCVPQVVAMRYEVGDDYARELAIRFYRRLLVNGYPTDEALAQARKDLLSEENLPHFGAVDPATPLIFGHAGRLFEPQEFRSKQMGQLYPRPQPLLAKSSLRILNSALVSFTSSPSLNA